MADQEEGASGEVVRMLVCPQCGREAFEARRAEGVEYRECLSCGYKENRLHTSE